MDREGIQPDRPPGPPGGRHQSAVLPRAEGTQETLEFTAIGGDVPNRGDVETTALLHAVHYLQTVADCADNSFIHKEPGLWLHVPATGEHPSETYVRQAVIPHGDSLLAQSSFFTTVSGLGQLVGVLVPVSPVSPSGAGFRRATV